MPLVLEVTYYEKELAAENRRLRKLLHEAWHVGYKDGILKSGRWEGWNQFKLNHDIRDDQ